MKKNMLFMLMLFSLGLIASDNKTLQGRCQDLVQAKINEVGEGSPELQGLNKLSQEISRNKNPEALANILAIYSGERDEDDDFLEACSDLFEGQLSQLSGLKNRLLALKSQLKRHDRKFADLERRKIFWQDKLTNLHTIGGVEESEAKIKEELQNIRAEKEQINESKNLSEGEISKLQEEIKPLQDEFDKANSLRARLSNWWNGKSVSTDDE